MFFGILDTLDLPKNGSNIFETMLLQLAQENIIFSTDNYDLVQLIYFLFKFYY